MGPYKIVNYEHTQGATFVDPWQVKENGNPKDITGARIEWILNDSVDNQTLVKKATSDTDDGIIISQPVDGNFHLSIGGWESINLGTYYHECWITYAGDVVDLLFRGSFTLKKGMKV